MRKIKLNCLVCGEVEIDHSFWNETSETIHIPFDLCPTIQSLGKFYKKETGETYESATGIKISEAFTVTEEGLLHASVDDIDYEEALKHTMGKVKCWSESY